MIEKLNMPNPNRSFLEDDDSTDGLPKRFLNRLRGPKKPPPQSMRDNKYQQRRERYMNERRAGVHHTSPPSRK